MAKQSSPQPNSTNEVTELIERAEGVDQPTKKPLRFVLVGIFNTGLDFALMNLFKLVGLPLLAANTLSTGIAMVCSFFLNKKWTFRHAGDNYVREVILFFVFTIIGIWVIQNGVIAIIEALLPSKLGLPDWLFNNGVKLIASLPSLTWNYLTYDRFVFTKKD